MTVDVKVNGVLYSAIKSIRLLMAQGGYAQFDYVEPQTQPETPEVTTYSITNNLTHVTTSNAAASVAENAAYAAALTAADGYDLADVSVTMGGADITETAYADGAISIAAVTGDLVITATAISAPVVNTVKNLFDKNTMVTTGSFVNTSGVVATSQGSKYATVPVTGGKTYAMQKTSVASNAVWNNGAAGLIGFYNDDMTKIGTASIPVQIWDESSERGIRTGVNWGIDLAYKGVCVVVPAGATKLLVTLQYSNGTDYTDTFMVEEGDTCHDYVAFA